MMLKNTEWTLKAQHTTFRGIIVSILKPKSYKNKKYIMQFNYSRYSSQVKN